MREKIKSKMDEYIEQILAKPAISDDEYAILKEKLEELPTKGGSEFGMSWLLLLITFVMMGGHKDEL